MAERCPECGSELPSGAPLGGLCPQCLLGLGLSATADETGPSTPSESDAVAEPAGGEVAHADVLTLPVGRRWRRRGKEGLAADAAPQIASETESLLRGRMQVGALIIFLGLVGWVIRDLSLAPPGAGSVTRLALIAFYGASIALLRSRRSLSLAQLRALELAIVGAVVLWFAFDRYTHTLVAIRNRDAGMTLWTLAFSVMVYFAILTAYAFLVPNSWRRALRVTGCIALVPIIVIFAIAMRDEESARFISEALPAWQLSSLAMVLGLGVTIATWGAHAIHTLRVEAFEARRLGQYQLTERIGAGGMGEVWKAEHQLLARPAAIKVIRPEVIDEKNPAMAHEFLRSFEREAQTTASLRSTHTVELYDFGMTADSAFYYVMELLDGLDLEGLVKQFGPLEPARVAYLLEQVCDSLADAHEHRLVHRDIKPANIQVCRMGRRYDFVKVLDFGLVKSRRAGWRGRAVGEGKGVVVGTPSYMAPEMVSGGSVDARADIYALGCVGYWLLTGRHVFEGSTTAEIVAQHVEAEVVAPARRVDREVPAELERIILACLEKDPSARPQSAEDLARRLTGTGLVDRWTQADAQAWWEENLPER